MLIYENRPSKMIFCGVKEFFQCVLLSKMGVKMNLRIITKNQATGPEKEFKIDFKAV